MHADACRCIQMHADAYRCMQMHAVCIHMHTDACRCMQYAYICTSGKKVELPPMDELQTNPLTRDDWIDYSVYDAQGTCMHTCVHAYMRAYMHACMHACNTTLTRDDRIDYSGYYSRGPRLTRSAFSAVPSFTPAHVHTMQARGYSTEPSPNACVTCRGMMRRRRSTTLEARRSSTSITVTGDHLARPSPV